MSAPRHAAAGEPAVRQASAETGSAAAPGDRVLLVTGMSGAGRSTALKSLEDIGYEAVDNLPISLLPNIVRREAAPRRPLAIGIDIRTRDFGAASFLAALDPLAGGSGIDLRVVFLDCEDELLRRRYTETRRRHPLAGDRQVIDGIRLERERVSPLRERADLVIDTSALTAADLRRLLQGHFALDRAPGVSVFVTSFSYRNGLPRDADLVFDVRFLENPHYVAALRPLTGLDPAIGTYLEDHGRLRGILIHSRQFPGWQSVGALFAHLKFVNSVHDKISKIALVTDSPMGTFADRVLDPLMLAKIRKFDYDKRDAAMSWLQG